MQETLAAGAPPGELTVTPRPRSWWRGGWLPPPKHPLSAPRARPRLPSSVFTILPWTMTTNHKQNINYCQLGWIDNRE